MIRAIHRSAALLLIFASLALAGCAATGPSGDYDDIIHHEVGTLEGRVQVADVIERTDNDLLRVQVTVRNPSAFRVNYQYKFRWFDAEGIEIAPEGEPWKPKELPPRSSDHLQGVAPNPAATRFELRVRN